MKPLPVVRLNPLPVVHVDGSWSDPKAYTAAVDRMKRDPMSLTDRDLAQLQSVSKSMADQAWGARRRAQLDFVHRHMQTSRVVPSLMTKSVDAAPADRTPADLDEFVRRYGKEKVTWAGLVKTMKETDGMYVTAINRLNDRVAALEAEINELKARPEVKYCGGWIQGQPYSQGSLVTQRGGLWLATSPTPGKPGTPDSGWKLIVKSGEAVSRDRLPVVKLEERLPVVKLGNGR